MERRCRSRGTRDAASSGRGRATDRAAPSPALARFRVRLGKRQDTMFSSMTSNIFMTEAWFGGVLFFGAILLLILVTARIIRGR